MSTVITSKDGIAFFQLLAIRGRLQIELRTGLKSKANTLAAAKRLYGLTSNTRKNALVELEVFMEGWKYAKGLDANTTVRNLAEQAAFTRGFYHFWDLIGSGAPPLPGRVIFDKVIGQ